MKYQVRNNKVVKVGFESVKKAIETINGIKVTKRGCLTEAGHKALVKALTKRIYGTSYVCRKFIVRAEQGSNNKEYGIRIDSFYGTGTNNPYTRAFINHVGENLAPATIQIKEFNKETKNIDEKYSVTTNTQTSTKQISIETNTVADVDFSVVESDLNVIFKDNANSSALIEAAKKEIVDSIITLGIAITNGKAEIATVNADKTNYDFHFTIVSWSPSSERNEAALFTSLNKDDAFDIVDKVSGSALLRAVEGYRELKDLKKFAKRLGQLGTPCIEAGTIGNKQFGTVIYMNEIKGPSDYTDEENNRLLGKDIDIDRNTYDGAGYFSVEYIIYMASLLGKKLSKSQALLLAIQARCNVVFTKIFGETLSQAVMQYIKDRLVQDMVKDGKALRILRVEAGQDVSKLKKEDFDLIIVGNEKNLGMIIDSNGGKTLADVSLQDIVNGNYQNYLLDIAKCSKTKTSGQMLQKFIAINKEKTMKVLLKLFNNQFNGRLDKAAEGDIDANNCGLAEFFFRHVEQGKFTEAALSSYIKNEIKQVESQAKKFSIELNAKFLRALFDFTYFLTQGKVDGILNANEFTGRLEAYSYDVELEYKDQLDAIWSNDSLTVADKMKLESELLTGVVFKYPSPSADERCVMTFVSSHTLIERITNHDLLEVEEKEILLDYFINTSYGVIKIAPNNTIKHRLAGMDTDYDGVAVVFEKELVEIIREADEKAGHDGITTKKSL